MLYANIGDTIYLHFAANDTSGSGADGASPSAVVRLCGAAADAAPVHSATPSLLSHASYPAGAHEVAIEATVSNGFAAGSTYAVFCTLLVDSQNPTGYLDTFRLLASGVQYPADATAAAQARIQAQTDKLATLQALAEADWSVDTTDPAQFKLIVKNRSTGATLLTKKLLDIAGNPITSAATPVAGQEDA